ncbi:MAG TPA: hypothetical protein VF587_10515 [Solirubrobacteraceae bacterium]
MRALLLAAAVATTLGFAVTDRARACSCAAPEPREALAAADAAVVGTFVDDGDPATLRVEETLKGDVPEEIELENDNDGDCGPGYKEGRRLGLFLQRTGDGWSAGICDTVEPDALRRAAQPLPEGRRGRAVLIATTFGEGQTDALLLDAGGAILAYGYGDGWGSASICPGSTHMLSVTGEGRGQQLVTRRLRDLKVVRRRALPRDEVFSFACRDRGGRRVALVDGVFDEPAPVRARLRLLGEGRPRVLRRGKITSATFIGDTAYLDEGRWGQDLVAVDLRAGEAYPIARVPYIPGAWELSPDGRRLATTAFGRELTNPTVTVVVDLRTGEVRKRVNGGSVLWTARDRLLNDAGDLHVLDARLRTLRSGDGAEAEWGIVRAGRRIYALDDGELREIDPRTARWRRIATLPSTAFRALTVIPGGAEIRARRGEAALSRAERRIVRAATACRRLLW